MMSAVFVRLPFAAILLLVGLAACAPPDRGALHDAALADTATVAPDATRPDDRALARAVMAGDLDAARAALGAGADPNWNPDGPDPMILAAAGMGDDRPDRDVVDSTLVRMLGTAGSDWALARDNDESALHVAVGRIPVVRALLAVGADPNDANNLDRQTPLHVAAALGEASTAGLLLAAGADASLRNAEGRTALDLALRNGDAATARLIK